jgi:electron transfer flavoprotein beta subunit
MPVKAVVVYKWARNAADAIVRTDGSIDWRNARMAAGEDDPAALAAAKQIAADTGGAVIGLTIGDGDASWALARGVEQAFSVADAPSLTDNGATAAILAAAVRYIGDVDVVVIGDSKQEPGVPVALAGELGWPALVGLHSASMPAGQLQAVRRAGAEQQTVNLATPVVLGMSAESDADQVPGMKELLAARKRPLTTLSLSDLGAAPVDLVSISCHKPDSTPTRVFDGDPAQAAAQLVAALRAEGVL